MTTQPTLPASQSIVVTDIDIPFWRLVAIFVKWALAAIPATIILIVIWMIVAAVFSTIFGHWMMRL
jgi:hypothetical protein